MRTNVHLNDELLAEAVRLSGGKSRREVIERALRSWVEAQTAERRRESIRSRLSELDRRIANAKLRQASSDLLRADRDRD
jgi:Arc/MetJ family transcription regulator